jgi:hypothetical protein
MAILRDSSLQDKKRLLELFPLAVFREHHAHLTGTKEEICYALAGQFAELELATFVRAHLPRCKQHVYIYDRVGNGAVNLPDVRGGEKSASSAQETLYIIRATYSVVLKDPLEEAEIDFLWPALVQVRERHIVVRFIALEKDVPSYFADRQCYVARKTIDEKKVLEDLGFSTPTDIHQGIKALWAEGFMDSPRSRYKKPESTAWEAMDEERGIREHNPELYETLLDSVLLNTLFVIEEDQRCGTSAFLANCQIGFLIFPRYSEAERNTDFVIDEILGRNQ